MDLARYTLLLTRGLFFARSRSFSDKWEGGWGGGDLAALREHCADLDVVAVQAAIDQARQQREDVLAGYGISCWHASDHESAALWDLYIPRGLGVAVCSTTSGVLKSLEPAGRAVEVLEVRYEQYDHLTFKGDPKMLLAHKRLEFSHEREVRFLAALTQEEKDLMASDAEGYEDVAWRAIPPGGASMMFRGFRPVVGRDETARDRTALDGVHLQTDLRMLIDRVVLSPQAPIATRRAVLDLSKAFGLAQGVIGESSADQAPYHQVRAFRPNG